MSVYLVDKLESAVNQHYRCGGAMRYLSQAGALIKAAHVSGSHEDSQRLLLRNWHDGKFLTCC